MIVEWARPYGLAFPRQPSKAVIEQHEISGSTPFCAVAAGYHRCRGIGRDRAAGCNRRVADRQGAPAVAGSRGSGRALGS